MRIEMQGASENSDPQPFRSLDETLACIREIESILLQLKGVKEWIGRSADGETICSLMDKAESEVAQAKRKLIQ